MRGSYYPPTVLTGVRPGMAVVEETFGPVAAVVLTPDMADAQLAVRELSVGTVKVNAAFGGAPGGAATPHGTSGDGFGYGPELLDELTRVRVVHIEPAPSPDPADLRRP